MSYFRSLLGIIVSEHPRMTNNLKNSAVTNLRVFVRKMIDDTKVLSSARIPFAEMIFEVLVSQRMD